MAIDPRHPDGDSSAAEVRIEMAYVLFLDLVGYSKLSNELQLARINRLESVVQSTAEFRRAAGNRQVVSLPTGDGMALVFEKFPEAPAQCAVEIAKAIQGDPEIELRMGINSGPAFPRRDIRGGENVVGAGAATRGIFGARVAAASGQPTATSTSGFVAPGKFNP